MTTVTSNPTSTASREAWAVNLASVWLVAKLDLKQRVRSTKWKVSLGLVGVLIGGVTLLVYGATHAFGSDAGGDVTFSIVVFFVLFLGLVVSPTLSATTLNGDVRDGTMAPLQVTGLSAADIVLGKLLAAWLASLAFLAVSVPFLLWGYVDGELPVVAMLQVIVVLAVELLLVCALGLGWSALTARTAASAVLTYTTVAVLTAVLPIIFGLSAAVFQSDKDVTYRNEQWLDPSSIDTKNLPDGVYKTSWGDYVRCEEYTQRERVPRTDLTWWMLAVNPYVIVADSSVAPGNASDQAGDYVLGGLKQAVREARLGPATTNDYCSDGVLTQAEVDRKNARDHLPPIWPWGLLAQALLGAGAVALGVRRIGVPYGKLPSGSRVA